MRPFCRACAGVCNSLPASEKVQHAIGAFCRWQHAAKSTRRLIGIPIGRIRADRRAKFPITPPLAAV